LFLLQIALFAWLGDNSYGKDALKLLTGAKIVQELLRRFTQTDQIVDALRVSVIYIKSLL